MIKTKIKKAVKEDWSRLINQYTPDYIRNKMDVDNYVLGKYKDNRSFCYMVEWKLADLGGIRGANASKFGLYYGQTTKDPNRKDYRPTKRFGKTKEAAFATIKEELASLIERVLKLNEFKDIKSVFTGMFKYKIMYLYNPKIMLPSFNKNDLEHFAKCLKIKPKNTFEKLQSQLMQYKKKYMPNETNHSFMANLYNKYGRYLSKKEITVNDNYDWLLNKNLCAKKTTKLTFSRTKVKPKTINGTEYYPRNPNVALLALDNADYKCENKGSHRSFKRRKGGKTYMEVHHLIPLCYYDEFDTSLDVPENVVSLCSHCHNEIHYGINSEKIIKKLYQNRKKKLLKVGIKISSQELLNKYKTIYNKD